MISIIKEELDYKFIIGKHRFEFEHELIHELAHLLTKDWILNASLGIVSWQSKKWKIEFAHDDNSPGNRKYESRDRILLWYGELKWHLTIQELLDIGDECRMYNI
jgi:hypothetical protein